MTDHIFLFCVDTIKKVTIPKPCCLLNADCYISPFLLHLLLDLSAVNVFTF